MTEDVAIKELRTSFRGEVLGPEDAGYDSARRIFNAMIDHRPQVIARPANADDVVRCIGFARARDLAVSVCGGGHSVAGKSVADGGLMIDFSKMKGIQIDPKARTALAEPGLRLGEFDRAAQAHGLATTLGIVSNTGIAGLTLGGGIGWLNGTFGLACDNVRSVDVVTADGRVVHASSEENPDLFWGVRGSGGNLGVVTSFEYQLHPVGQVLGGLVIHPWSDVREALRFFGEFASDAPDEISVLGVIVTAPDGNPAFAIALGYTGPMEKAEAAVAPLRSFGKPMADMVAPMSYLELQSMLDQSFQPGFRHYWKSSFLPRVTEDAVEVLVEYGATKPSPMTGIGLQQMHGAAARVGPGDTAFPHRRDQFDCIILSVWSDPADTAKNVRWARGLFEAMQPYLGEGVYVNDLGDEGDDRIRAAYGPNYDRLVELKTKYDPENFFHLNQNIAPAVAAR